MVSKSQRKLHRATQVLVRCVELVSKLLVEALTTHVRPSGGAVPRFSGINGADAVSSFMVSGSCGCVVKR